MKTHVLNDQFKADAFLVQFAQPCGAQRLLGLQSLGHWSPKNVI